MIIQFGYYPGHHSYNVNFPISFQKMFCITGNCIDYNKTTVCSLEIWGATVTGFIAHTIYVTHGGTVTEGPLPFYWLAIGT